MTKPVPPVSIINNNPVALLTQSGPDAKTRIVNGLCAFDTLEAGVTAYFYRMWGAYHHAGHVTLTAYVADTYRATACDLFQVEMAICKHIGWSPLGRRNIDMMLRRPWNALLLARAEIDIASGRPHRDWPSYPDWVRPGVLLSAMHRTGKWPGL
jgi:hypothetical protein